MTLMCRSIPLLASVSHIPYFLNLNDLVNDLSRRITHFLLTSALLSTMDADPKHAELLASVKKYLPSDLLSLLDRLLNFAKESTKAFDESHNWIHALEVTRNALAICEDDEFKSSTNVVLLLTLSMLHDVCDHKYKELSITQQQLVQFIDSLSSIYSTVNSTRLMKIIDSVSYSKQVKKATLEHELTSEELNLLRILRDADRIEAIGARGIERCYQFTQQANPTFDEIAIKKDVIQHCHEKLLRLYPEHFICTQGGRKIAEPLHQEMIVFVSQNS